MTVVVATGVEREAAVLRRLPGVVVVTGGGDAAGLRRRLEAAVPGARGIASVGMAGALDPAIGRGDWIVADRITGPVDYPCDPAWSVALAAALPNPHRGPIYADGRLIGEPEEKRRLASMADAVDMESHVAAAVGVDHGLPFVAIRCISDATADTLPPAIAVAMHPDGGLNLLAIVGSLARTPGQIAAVARTGMTFARAFSTFKRQVTCLPLASTIDAPTENASSVVSLR